MVKPQTTRKLLPAAVVSFLSSVALALGAPLSQEPNTLSAAETEAGWQLMFDGNTLAGWHSFKKPGITDNGWIIQDSAIFLRGPAAGALLAPEAFTYRNFDISIDWKLPDSGNSGIFVRYLETEERESIRTGPETQICGRLHPDYRGGTAVTSPGACYAMYAPAHPWIRPAGEYNTLRIIMFEEKVAHYGNGSKLVEYAIGDSEWTAKFEMSKYNSFPLYGDIHAGKLFLQDHASRVWYRNVKIRPLASDPWADPGFVWPDREVGILARRLPRRESLRLSRTSDGRIQFSSRVARDWDIGLYDPLGRGLGRIRGAGIRMRTEFRASAGFYLPVEGNGSGKSGKCGKCEGCD